MLLDIIYLPTQEESVEEWKRGLENFVHEIRNFTNVRCIVAKEQKLDHATLNDLKSKVEAKYFIFTNADYSHGLLLKIDEIISFLKKKSISLGILNVYRIDRNNQELHFSPIPETNLTDKSNYININLYSYLFNKEIAQDIDFKKFIFDFDSVFIAENLEKTKKYDVIDIKIRTNDYPETDYYNYRRQYWEQWYIPELQNYVKYIDGDKNFDKRSIIQRLISFLIQLRFACNRNNRNKNIFQTEEESFIFYGLVSSILKKINLKWIVYYNLGNKKLLPKYMCYELLKIRDGNSKVNILSGAMDVYVGIKDKIIERSTNFSFEIKAINNTSDKLVIYGELSNVYALDWNKIQLQACTGGNKIRGERNFIYSLDKYFGKEFKSGCCFEFVIQRIALGNDIIFKLKYLHSTIILPIRFVKTAARLTNQFKSSYFIKFNKIFKYDSENFRLKLLELSTFNVIKSELSLWNDFVREIFNPINKRPKYVKAYSAIRAIMLRSEYWATKLLLRKRKKIWVTFDQLFKGGDNGEYFFRYTHENGNKEIQPFYIINRDSIDGRRLFDKYGGSIIDFNSNKSRRIALKADIVLATRVDVKQYLGFTNPEEHYYRDLLTYKVICLQHGLSIQEIAEYQNKLFDNTKLYFCASKYEIKNLLQDEYGYKKNELILTGLPRYDGLYDRKQKIILIAPTWRRNITAGTNQKGKQHNYSENFKYSAYFKIYNSLINNKILISEAKALGYRLIYLIHPILSPQLNDFSKNDYVEIMGGANNDISYEKMLTEAALMVTDHSGIQYDFAYMKKPIIYYHPDELPPQYMAKTMNYSDMGFGPICRTEKEIVSELINYMKNNCEMTQKYVERVDNFFAFSDKQNCARIYKYLCQR